MASQDNDEDNVVLITANWQSWINLTKCVLTSFSSFLCWYIHSLIPIHADMEMIDAGNINADNNVISSLQLVSFKFI